MALTPKLMKLAGDLLEEASEIVSNHTCNDWDWPADFTIGDRRQIATDMVARNVGKHVGDLNEAELHEAEELAKTGPPDWWIMSYLAERLQEG